jgi:DNA-binding transcriptional LysR family regulator
MARVQDWNLYRSFLAVAEAGSFSGAARRIGTAQPTIGRHVAALEDGLGARLFQRSPRGLVLTAVGQDLVRHAQAMASAVSAAERDASSGVEAETGTVRITAGEYLSAEVLPPILAEVANAHPKLEFEVVASNRTEDLLMGEADIAVRMVAPSQQALVARRLGTVRTALFAHRSYVERAGLPDAVEDLTAHRLIGFDRDFSILRTSRPAPPLTREDFGFRTDNTAVQTASVRAGLGIGALHIAAARDDPDLVPILPDQLVFERDVWLAMHEDLRRVRRVRLVFDALADGLLGYLARDPR